MQTLSQLRSSINGNIKATETYQRENKSYESETEQQVLRLESVNLFPKNISINNAQCPLCNHELSVRIPTIEQINNSLLGLQTNLEITKINAAVDLLIESDVDLSNALGKDGLIKQLSKRILERALEAEMDNHLGYSRYDRSNTQNARNGGFQKNLITCRPA